jgi:hypothetical protein
MKSDLSTLDEITMVDLHVGPISSIDIVNTQPMKLPISHVFAPYIPIVDKRPLVPMKPIPKTVQAILGPLTPLYATVVAAHNKVKECQAQTKLRLKFNELSSNRRTYSPNAFDKRTLNVIGQGIGTGKSVVQTVLENMRNKKLVVPDDNPKNRP